MSRGFVKEGDQEELPVVPPRAFLPSGMANYVTPEGMQALENEKHELIAEKEEIISGKGRQAGNESDKRIAISFINAKLVLLEERIHSAVVIKPQKQPKGVVCFGTYVVLEMGKDNSEKTIKITGTDEADTSKGYISYFSPLAKALSGHKKGETIEIPLPAGKQEARILSISFTPSGTPTKEKTQDSGSTKKEHSGGKTLSIKNHAPRKNVIMKPALATEATVKTSTGQITESIKQTVRTAKQEEKAINEDANEIFPIVNERGITIGRAPRWQCHDGSKLLHPVVHLHLFNSKGELYLQKRPHWKKIQPDKYDTAVGGHVGFGERIEDALAREAKEEIGIIDFNSTFIKRYIYESPQEKELIHIYITIYNNPVAPSNELDGGRFWTKEEIADNIGKKIFTPNFESEYRTYISKLNLK